MQNTNIEASVSQLNPQVASELSQFVVGPAVFEIAEVQFHAGKGVVADYAEALADNLASITSIGQTMAVTKDNMERYLNTLLCVRIWMVVKDNQRHSYLNSVPYPVVPALFSAFLENVGYAKDELLGIELKPSFQYDKDKTGTLSQIMSTDEFSKFSHQLSKYAKAGFEYADRLPRDPRGSWDVMSMQYIKEVVDGNNIEVIRHHDGKSSAFAAMFASLYNQTWLQALMIPRVSYGPTIRFKGLVGKLAELKG